MLGCANEEVSEKITESSPPGPGLREGEKYNTCLQLKVRFSKSQTIKKVHEIFTCLVGKIYFFLLIDINAEHGRISLLSFQYHQDKMRKLWLSAI